MNDKGVVVGGDAVTVVLMYMKEEAEESIVLYFSELVIIERELHEISYGCYSKSHY